MFILHYSIIIDLQKFINSISNVYFIENYFFNNCVYKFLKYKYDDTEINKNIITYNNISFYNTKKDNYCMYNLKNEFKEIIYQKIIIFILYAQENKLNTFVDDNNAFPPSIDLSYFAEDFITYTKENDITKEKFIFINVFKLLDDIYSINLKIYFLINLIILIHSNFIKITSED